MAGNLAGQQGGGGLVSSPANLSRGHIVRGFDCGEPALDDWLKNDALKAGVVGDAVTKVVCKPRGRTVVGYYALAAGRVDRHDVSGSLARNAPKEVPVIILARLAIDKRSQGLGIAKALIRDALRRAVNAAKSIGARAVIVHALNIQLVGFYKRLGFQQVEKQPTTLYYPMKKLITAASGKRK